MTKEGGKIPDLTTGQVREQLADETDSKAIKRLTAAREYLEGLSPAEIEDKYGGIARLSTTGGLVESPNVRGRNRRICGFWTPSGSMRDKITLSEKCIELGKRATDEEDEPAAPEDGGGFSEAFKLAVNMLRIGAEETYRSLEALLEHTPAIRDGLEINEGDVPDYSTVCKWYQEIMMEVWRLLLRHSAEIAGTSGRAAIDNTFFERHQASSHYVSRTNYTFDKLKITLLVHIESQAVLDLYSCCRALNGTGLIPVTSGLSLS